MPRRILLVDDDAVILESLSEALEADRETRVETAETGDEGLAAVSEFEPDVVLSDVRMPGMDGLELLSLLEKRAPDVDVILMTAYEDMPTVVHAMREGAVDFLVKPLDLSELRSVLEGVFEDRLTRARKSRAAEDEKEPYRLSRIVGQNAAMIEIFKLVGKVASNRTNVLIQGESGTGKELVARAIHYNSPDASEPFVPVNCTALPPTLLESELFGHRKGSFTGAVENRRGRFSLAGRGTIFLDEVGDTSPEFQTKLLRVLEEREFYPVGAEHPERTEARVIAATHRDLSSMVSEGRFREDFYYRLRVVEMELPPLRRRLDDLPHLAEHLLEKAAREMHRSDPPVLSDGALDRLLSHDWPGNVRELENCMIRALVIAPGEVIRAEHVQLHEPAVEKPGDLPSLSEVERTHVARVLASTRGHKTRTAEILEISRARLYRLLEKYDLD